MNFPPSTSSPHAVGRYTIYREIASGGMATVYVGKLLGAVGFARTVAIKRLHPHFAKDSNFVSMFVDEALLASRIQHPNVVSTLDVVSTDTELFLVMDYVQGESLFRLFRVLHGGQRRIPLSIALSIMAGVFYGLHAAHEATGESGEPLHIVHRDVSPQNILVGSDGVPRVLDFGIAKAESQIHTTGERSTKGKLVYMTPEQLSGQPVDRRTDIFAASMVLWEALTGQRLLSGETEAQLVNSLLHSDFQPPSRIVPRVPRSVDAIVMRGLAKNPDDRFQTAREVAIALEKIGRLATAREIGDFVEQEAAETLKPRAKMIADIDSACRRASIGSGALEARRSQPSFTDASAFAAYPPPSFDQPRRMQSSATSLTLSTPGESEPAPEPHTPAPSSSRVLLAAAAGAVVAIGLVASTASLLAGRAFGVGHAAPGDTVASPPGSTQAVEDRPVETIQSVDPPGSAIPAAPPASKPLASVDAPSPSSEARKGPETVKKTSPSTDSLNQARKARNCDPGFTVDANGVRRYKPECL